MKILDKTRCFWGQGVFSSFFYKNNFFLKIDLYFTRLRFMWKLIYSFLYFKNFVLIFLVFKFYYYARKNIVRTLPFFPHLVVYLDAPAKICLENVKKRGNVSPNFFVFLKVNAIFSARWNRVCRWKIFESHWRVLQRRIERIQVRFFICLILSSKIDWPMTNLKKSIFELI